ncbi:PIG-L family deacetylase [Erythrobacter citreus]|uniref:LmbE family N-acetylglucosaminyl deacetylase n=1 Tax=Qipengyuania citrea TaxID=225971 RepID=A0A6I4UGX5_9SPHN|nr:PIG-L family deacetylase [Qipengyuania citrea]MDQ0567353.1 LmbE family N-acetylglucosaminyl deacetylase [Qipengyuania citrea]MXP36897.1 PIG-L family deacetylase [Qipengyuania citrea]
MKRHLVIAPHPDDETLGCGGTLLRSRAAGNLTYWLIVTGISSNTGFSAERVEQRESEIRHVAEAYGFAETIRLNIPTSTLDHQPLRVIIGGIAEAVKRLEPTDVYLPYRRDAHSDHAAVFDAGITTAKWFRYSSVQRTYAYETQSETDFDMSPDSPGFRPNVFVDISDHIDEKIRIAEMFVGEIGEHPFPRSARGIRAMATVRGAACGFDAAEAFMLLRERVGGAAR